MRSRVLPRRFYARDARAVAPELLNKVLEHREADGTVVRARVVEVEAYAGSEDAGSHAFRGMTPRNATMFGPPGRLYVYFTYGMHWCANVVCGTQGVASAVLLRAGAPLSGLVVMQDRRTKARRERDLCSGPAKLAQAFGLDRSFDGADLVCGPVRILDDGVAPPRRPGRSARVGLHPERGADHPWRWFVPGDPNVSRR
ncbi:MAG: DNA-3-methyladenine glycosylase [Acidimicrobiia bacterium]